MGSMFNILRNYLYSEMYKKIAKKNYGKKNFFINAYNDVNILLYIKFLKVLNFIKENLQNLEIVFQIWLYPFIQAVYESSSCSTWLPALGMDTLLNFVMVLICISLITNDPKNLFMCLFATLVFSSMKCQIFSPFKKVGLFILLFSYKSSFYIPDMLFVR